MSTQTAFGNDDVIGNFSELLMDSILFDATFL